MVTNASVEARRHVQRQIREYETDARNYVRPVAVAEWIPANRYGGMSFTERRLVRFGIAFSARSVMSASYPPLFAIQVIIELAKLAGGSVVRLIKAKQAAVLDWCWEVSDSKGYFTLAKIQADAANIMATYELDYLDASQVSDCIGVLADIGSVENCELGNYRVIEEVTWLGKKA